MSKIELIVNEIRNPDKKIYLDKIINNREEHNDINLIIKKFEIEEENNDFYTFDNFKISPEINVSYLIFKNINIDISNCNFCFRTIKILSLNNSIINLSKDNHFCSFGNLENMEIKGDLNLIKQNLNNLKDKNILSLINQISIKIISKSSSKTNIFSLFKSLKSYISIVKNSFNIFFKGLLEEIENENKNEIKDLQNSSEILSKIKKIYLFSLNKINKKTGKIIIEQLINKLNNIEELFLNENIECELDNKLKLFSYINDNNEININYNLYDIKKLNKISIPICEYNKNKKSLLLYGEANMSFYNLNNKELIMNLIKNNHKGKLALLSLCNFDLENIDYLTDLINKSIINADKLVIKNLNINEDFILVLKNKNLFNCTNLNIENIIFVDDEIENKFYEFINNYNNCESLKLISIEDFSKYNNIIINNNLNKLLLEEIYDMNYKSLNKIINKRKVSLSSLTLKNLEISEDEDKNIIIGIIEFLKNNIMKLKIIGGDFNFLFKSVKEKQIEFSKLEKLILYIDKEKNEEEETKLNSEDFCFNDNSKILYLKNNYKLLNYKGIKKIDLQIFSISSNDIKDIMKIYNNLYELY